MRRQIRLRFSTKEAALDYAQIRKQFGKPIVDNQGLQWMLADMAKDIQAARLLVRDAATKLENGEPATAACSMAKCFAGDMAGTDRLLPPIEQGDYVVLHDTGAYYFSNPFYYNALPAPAVYGASREQDGPVRFDCWREQQSMNDMLDVIG